MRKQHKINTINFEEFKLQLLAFGSKLKNFAFLNSTHYKQSDHKYSYHDFDFLAALSAKSEILNLNDLKNTCNSKHDWLFGFLSYDLKNEIEDLTSNNLDELNFPDLHFFIPELVIISSNNEISVLYDDQEFTLIQVLDLIKSIEKQDYSEPKSIHEIKLQHRFTKKEYLETVADLKKHIQRGDIYEINFCQEFFSKNKIDPIDTYIKLNKISPTPFSCFYKLNDQFLISASPERFIKKIDKKIISQPIKGTLKRSSNISEDTKLKEQLYNDPKERAENVMIVDLVRNDLSRTALKGSVKVEELFGIYSFKQVHQMISTIVSEVDPSTNIIDIIKNAFPMGSMTGAPKIRAMQLIEDYEKTKRGLYSGSVGYITPDNNFDFNVVIRSILYNQLKKYVSFTVGGAITSLADPEKEYEECLVKAEAMLKALC